MKDNRQASSPAGPGAARRKGGTTAASAVEPLARMAGALRRISMACALAARAAPAATAVYVVLMFTAGALPVVIAWLTKLVVDGLIGDAGLGTLLRLGACLAALGLIAGVIPQVMQYLQAHTERAVGLLTQDRLFTAVDRLVGLARFEDPQFLDRLRLAQQVGSTTPSQVIDGCLGAGRAALTVTGFLGSLAVLSPPLMALALAMGLPTLVAEIVLSRRRARMLWSIGPVERREFFYTRLLSSVEAAKEVRLFGTGSFLRQRMLAERRTANAAKRDVDQREAFTQAGLGLLTALTAGGGLLWAMVAAHHGRISVGDVTIFVAAIAGVQSALRTVASELARCHHALAMFTHYAEITTTGPDLPTARTPRALPPLTGAIELRDVWFRYSDDHEWVLQGVDLRIPCGKALAIVGLNGAGKSTLVKLLCRFYDPTKGAILWDGVDIREVDSARLRRRIGAVFQDYMEYDLTAAENIGLGDLNSLPDRERLAQAARRAGIHDTLAALPRGYDTLLSRMFFMDATAEDDPQAGVVLSGGQWQRLALARALLRHRSELMILDEPSAGLDPEAEYEIHSFLRRHRAGRTSVLISHRLAAIRDADLIVVLSDGQIAEQGDHTALMALDGEYARLFRLQASGYRSTEDM